VFGVEVQIASVILGRNKDPHRRPRFKKDTQKRFPTEQPNPIMHRFRQQSPGGPQRTGVVSVTICQLLSGLKAGFRMMRQAPVTIINNAYHEDAFAYWAARLIVAFATARNLVLPGDADNWIRAIQDAQTAGRFFFSSTAVLRIAIAA
jgi:hypothetical protein